VYGHRSRRQVDGLAAAGQAVGALPSIFTAENAGGGSMVGPWSSASAARAAACARGVTSAVARVSPSRSSVVVLRPRAKRAR
jgi:hypothetical protein